MADRQSILITHEQIKEAFGEDPYPSPMTVEVTLKTVDLFNQTSEGVDIECTNPVPTTLTKPELVGAFETLIADVMPSADTDLEALEWSVEEDSGGGFAEVSGSPFDDDVQHVYAGTGGYTYRVRVRGRDVFDQVGTWSSYSDEVELSPIGPGDLTDDVWQMVATDYDSNTPATLAALYDAVTASGGVAYTVTTPDKWIEFSYPVQHVMSQIMFWLGGAANVYFAVSEDGSTWSWLAAQADHTGAGTYDDILVPVANQAAAQSDYLTAASGMNRYIFPVQKYIKKARVYLASSITVREIMWWKLVAADEIRTGILASLNLSATLGSYFDLDDGVFKMGGTASPKFSWNGTALAVVGNITITGGSGISALTDAGNLATADDLDDVGDGSTYGKLRKTDLSGGHIKLTSSVVVDGEWYDESGVEIDAATGITIYGTAAALRTRATKGGADQCYVGADGFIYAGAGVVALSASGIRIAMGTGTPNRIEWMDGAVSGVYVYGFESGSLYYGYFRADRSSRSGFMYVSAASTGGTAYLGGENTSGNMNEIVASGPNNRVQLNAAAGGIVILTIAGAIKVQINNTDPVLDVKGTIGFDGGTTNQLRRNLNHLEWHDGTSWVQLDNGP